jgi:exosome complex component RRP42
MCGIRAEVGLVPLANDPKNSFDRRQLVVNLEMLPLCSPHIRAGRPTEKSQIVAQNLNDLCDNILDVASLHSTSDVAFSNNQIASWFLYADLYCLDYEGNIQDCATIALMAALKSTLLPPIIVSPAGEACISSKITDRVIPLRLSHNPISTTFGIFEDFVFADPNLEEEGLLTGTLCVTYDEKGNLCSLDMPGGSTMADEQIKECMKLAKTRVSKFAAQIDSIAANHVKKQQASQ